MKILIQQTNSILVNQRYSCGNIIFDNCWFFIDSLQMQQSKQRTRLKSDEETEIQKNDNGSILIQVSIQMAILMRKQIKKWQNKQSKTTKTLANRKKKRKTTRNKENRKENTNTKCAKNQQ